MLAEQMAIQFLLQKGFFVFKNLYGVGPADLIAINEKGAVAALIVSLIISFITAYIAYQCNSGENAGVRFIVTLFAFFFSGFFFVAIAVTLVTIAIVTFASLASIFSFFVHVPSLNFL